MGWVLTSIASLQKELTLSNDQVPPVGIFPLGTGNDLGRSFGWVCGFDALHSLCVVDLDNGISPSFITGHYHDL